MDKVTKVEAVDSVDKSAQDIERELLEGAGGGAAAGATEDAIPTIKVASVEAGDDKREPVVEQKEEIKEEPVVQNNELTDESVLSHIRKQTGREVNSWDDLIETKEVKVEIEKELDPEVSQYLKYKQETGRSMGDFMKLNRDFDSESDDAILAEFYSVNNPYLDANDIEYKLNAEFKFDTDIDEDHEIRGKKIAKKEKLAEARQFFKDQKETYKAPLGSSDGFISSEKMERFNQYEQSVEQAEERKQQDAKRADIFNKKTNDLFSNNFEGFGYKVGEENFTVKVDDVEATQKLQSNAMNFVGKHLDENGEIKDAAAYHKALNAAMDPDALFKFAYELGASRAIDADVREAKNIDMSAKKAGGKATDTKPRVESVSKPTRKGGLTIRKRQ